MTSPAFRIDSPPPHTADRVRARPQQPSAASPNADSPGTASPGIPSPGTATAGTATAGTATAGTTSAGSDAPQRVIRCETTAEFLAALPQLVGFTATDSLFVVLFTGARAEAVMRIDLPASEDTGTVDAYLTEVLDRLLYLQPEPEDTRPAVVISSSRGFAAAGGAPWRVFAQALEDRFAHVGLSLRELCCVAPDGWVSFLEPDAPAFGHPRSLIDASATAPAVAVPTLAELSAFRNVSDGERDAVDLAGVDASCGDGDAADTAAGPVPGSDRFTRARSQLARLSSPEALTPEESASLIRVLRTDTGWACVFDGLTENAALAHAVHRTPAVRAALRQIAAVSEQLAFLVPLVPRSDRPAIMALSALAWWVRGVETVASSHIAAAAELDPEHRVVALARSAIDGGSFSMTIPPAE